MIKRELHQEAKQILVEDAAGIFLFWARTAQFRRSYLRGKSLAPSQEGISTYHRTRLGLTPDTLYVTSDCTSGRLHILIPDKMAFPEALASGKVVAERIYDPLRYSPVNPGNRELRLLPNQWILPET
jgi:hypothetical protein